MGSYIELRDELLKDPEIRAGYDQEKKRIAMKTNVVDALHLLQKAETLTHADMPADFLGMVDAATNDETTEGFAQALEAHKSRLRKQAIMLLEAALV